MALIPSSPVPPAPVAPRPSRKLPPGFIVPSAALTAPARAVRRYAPPVGTPQVGDLMFGKVVYIGQHSSIENRHGRLHMLNDGARALFVYGNRYAPDFFEGFVPEQHHEEVDLLARSGVIGVMRVKNANIKDPTRIRVLGAVVDADGTPVNTKRFSIADARRPYDVTRKRARMILVIGTSMNSGKSTAAIACCWALSSMGHRVRACKVTGTASLKDILHMQDGGARPVADFSYLGYPSTYMLPEEEVVGIFQRLDGRFGNNPANFWVVEIADGLLQRETAMLLSSPVVRQRVHRLVFTATDTFGAIGGIRVLRERFGLVPSAISGLCAASPLGVRELREFTDTPVFNSRDRDLRQLCDLLL